ncbi:hypothetical protein MFLO_01560 [Listeria floridensis FSL S10-1187]|uniref:Uncharacterized protein n=1 Tax=Listeria floridensis FSL S10-1187 TaxID=1265817 RepID=A0ABP3B3Z6_9LIST|nr:hypothetical protein MFLO_01560 [Listeria floridensis FSL S10-1187]
MKKIIICSLLTLFIFSLFCEFAEPAFAYTRLGYVMKKMDAKNFKIFINPSAKVYKP